MRKSAILTGLLIFSLAAAALAQEELPKLVERIEVRVVNVDVVVTDKKGNHIKGLTKDDFELVENDAPQSITNFFEATGAPAAEQLALEVRPTAEQQRRHIVVFIDQVSLDPQNRNRVIKYLRTFLDDAIRENDEVMIATYHRRLDVRLPFTDNHEAVQKTLSEIEKEPAAGIDLLHGRRDTEIAIRNAELPLQRMLIARTYALNAEQRLHGTVESLLNLMSTVAGVEGKKVLVMVGESLPMQPGREILALLDRYDDRRTNPFEPRTELDGDVSLDTGPVSPPNRFSSVLDASFNARALIEEVARTANANAITLYPIHAGGISGGRETVAEFGSDGPEAIALADDMLKNSAEAMKYVADLTGGRAIVGANHFENALSDLQNDLNSYYSLGYKANDDVPGQTRRVRVRVKNPQYVVRTRRELIDKSPTQQMSDLTLANLLAVQKANDLGIVLSVDQPVPEGRNYRVPVRVQIPMEKLTVIPRGDLHQGGFELFAVLGNARNAISKVVRLPHKLSFDQTQFAKVKDRYYTYKMDVMMRGGTNQLSVAVVDQVSGTQGFGRVTVAAQ